jgi:hypothetical protein
MFMLYAVPIGIIAGFLAGGHLAGLGRLHFRWWQLAVVGFLAQTVLFLEPVAAGVGALGPPLYVASTAVVLAAILANAGIPGMPIVAVGASLNLLVILANGGCMPASATAYAEHGLVVTGGYSNTRILAEPVLGMLGDVISLPVGLPLSNVISVGDILIVMGTAAVIALAMRSATAPATVRGGG